MAKVPLWCLLQCLPHSNDSPHEFVLGNIVYMIVEESEADEILIGTRNAPVNLLCLTQAEFVAQTAADHIA